MPVSRPAEAAGEPLRPTILLADLLHPQDGARIGPWDGIVVHGLETDSRRIEPGDLFVALAGLRTEGARFAQDAVARGACAVVTARADLLPEGVPALLCPEPRELLPRIAARLYGHPEREVRLVGVTGTNGKTTTTLLAGHLLRAAGRSTGYWTTTEVDTGERRFRPLWTTPMPPDLMRFLRHTRDAGGTWAAIEVSSHALSLGRIEGLSFEAVTVTNLSPDHLDFHPTLSDYARTKRRLLTYTSPSGAAFLSDDDPIVRTWSERAPCRTFRYGLKATADLGAEAIRQEAGRMAFTLTIRDDVLRERSGGVQTVALEMPLIGLHNVKNALAACGMALWVGVDPGALASGLATFRSVPRRLERLTVGPYTVINDVAMNEASYDTVLEAVVSSQEAPGRLTVVHALRGGRGPEVNARVMRALAAWNAKHSFAPLIVTLSRDALERYGEGYQVTPEELEASIRAAREAEAPLPLDVHTDLETAISAAVERVRPGDTLLLLGTFGMDDGPALAHLALARRLGLPLPDPGGYPDPGVGPDR